MIEVEIYLCARHSFTTDNDMGGYGYVIKSETYSSTSRGSYNRTSKDRMAMMACIEAMKETCKNVGAVVKVIIYTKQSELINAMMYGHCLKFKNYPHQDLVKQALELRRYFSFYVRTMPYSGCDEMKLANKLSKEALKNTNRKLDLLDFKRSEATPLF